MNASEETKVTNVGSQVRRYLDYSNLGGGEVLDSAPFLKRLIFK